MSEVPLHDELREESVSGGIGLAVSDPISRVLPLVGRWREGCRDRGLPLGEKRLCPSSSL